MGDLEEHSKRLQEKYRAVQEKEIMFEEIETADADIILVAYGTAARVCKAVIAGKEGLGARLGLFRPISLWPFPSNRLAEIAESTKAFLTVEMSRGQMVEDVRLSVGGARPVEFFGRLGGGIPTEEEIRGKIKAMVSSFGK